MADVIIRKKDVDRLAKELLKEVYNFLHDNCILTNFIEMKDQQTKFLNRLVFNHIVTFNKKGKITKEEKDNLHKPFLERYFNNPSETGILFKEVKIEYDPKLVEDAMKDGGVDTEGIYNILNDLDLDDEIDGDLYYKNASFLDIYRVFETGYRYLED